MSLIPIIDKHGNITDILSSAVIGEYHYLPVVVPVEMGHEDDLSTMEEPVPDICKLHDFSFSHQLPNGTYIRTRLSVLISLSLFIGDEATVRTETLNYVNQLVPFLFSYATRSFHTSLGEEVRHAQ